MQKKIDILSDLINKSGLSITQKQLAFDSIGEIVSKYNISEAKYLNRIKSDHKIRHDFYDYFDRAKICLHLLGINDLDLMKLNYKYISWINANLYEFKAQLTFYSLNQIMYYLELYENCYDGKIPDDLCEFKAFILEPFEIKESSFDEAYRNALIEFKNTGNQPEILKIGWFKQLTGKIKTSYLI